MKKIIALLLAATMCISIFTACGSSSNSTTTTTSGDSSENDVEEITSYLEINPVDYKASDYVTLGDYSSFTVDIDAEDYEVTDETVEGYLNQIFETYGYMSYKWLDKDETETGDTINCNIYFTIDGIDTGNDCLDDVNIVLGQNFMQIDGFDEELTGKDANEVTYEFTLTFPDDYGLEDYQGQTADFFVTINGVVEEFDMTYDLLTDSYVYDAFGYTTVDEYLADVKANLEEYYESKKTTDVQIKVVDQLLASSEIKGVPEGLKELRVNEYKNQYIYTANSNGQSLVDYLDDNGLTSLQWDEQVSSYIDDAINKELIYMAIAEKEGITTDSSDYTSYVAGMKDTLGMTENDFNKAYPEDYCKLLFKEQCVLDLLIENTTVNEK